MAPLAVGVSTTRETREQAAAAPEKKRKFLFFFSYFLLSWQAILFFFLKSPGSRFSHRVVNAGQRCSYRIKQLSLLPFRPKIRKTNLFIFLFFYFFLALLSTVAQSGGRVDRGRWRPFRPVVKLNGSPPPPPPHTHTFAGSHAEPPGHAGQHTVPTHTQHTHTLLYFFFSI